LAEALRTALADRLAANSGALTGQGVDRPRVSLPVAAGRAPAALGRMAGHRIAAALARPKGGG
jgi:hypothetical protein